MTVMKRTDAKGNRNSVAIKTLGEFFSSSLKIRRPFSELTCPDNEYLATTTGPLHLFHLGNSEKNEGLQRVFFCVEGDEH